MGDIDSIKYANGNVWELLNTCIQMAFSPSLSLSRSLSLSFSQLIPKTVLALRGSHFLCRVLLVDSRVCLWSPSSFGSFGSFDCSWIPGFARCRPVASVASVASIASGFPGLPVAAR